MACTPKVDTAKENAMIDSMANAKLMMMRDSMKMDCSNMIDSLAMAKSDSMIDAPSHKGGSTKPKNPKADMPKVDIKKGDIKIVNPTNTDPKSSKMNGGTSTSTQDKSNKMSGNTSNTSSTTNKTDKMNKPKN